MTRTRDTSILTHQLDRLFAARLPLTVNVVNASIVVALFWGDLPAAALLGWLAAMTIIVATRLALSFAYERRFGALLPAQWARLHVLGSGLTGLAWGATGAAVLVVDDPVLHLLVGLAAAGMGAGALASSVVYLPSFLAFLLTDVLPVALGFALHPGGAYSGIAAMMVAFVAMLALIARTFDRAFHRTLALQAQLVDSEQRMRDFAETASDWFWEQDADLRFTFVSSSYQDKSGIDPRQHYGQTRRETDPDGVTAAQWAAHEADLAARRPFTNFQYVRVRPDGTHRHLSVSGRPYYDAAGVFKGYRGTGTDVTDLVDAEESARASEQRFRDFASAAGHWVWETDAEFRFVFVSDGFERFTGIPAAAIIGRRGNDISVDDPARRAATQTIDRMMRAREPFMDVVVPRPLSGGRMLYQAVSAKPAFDADGAFLGYRGVTRDITAQREAETAAEQMRAERDLAAGADRAKTQFLANMSHELRTPLNAIIGFSEIMTSGLFGPVGNPRHAAYVADISKSAHHLLDVINDLLDMSRIELNKREIERAETSLGDIVRESTAMVGALAEQHELAIDAAGVRPDLSLLVEKRAIKQILVNLLSNAIKFTAPGGRIAIVSRIDADGALRVAVRDSGAGIPARELPTVFDAFATSDARRARGGGGAGLGLWISRALARLHGGDLTIESVEGRGTTATLVLPASSIVATGPRLQHAGRKSGT